MSIWSLVEGSGSSSSSGSRNIDLNLSAVVGNILKVQSQLSSTVVKKRSEAIAVTINPLKEENVMSELLEDGVHCGIKCAIEADVKNVDVVEGKVVEMERGEVISDDTMVHLGLDVRYDGALLRSK
ncbi:hypothetical protein ACOSQ2_009830 [Xanthoceras sorbifolium]